MVGCPSTVWTRLARARTPAVPLVGVAVFPAAGGRELEALFAGPFGIVPDPHIDEAMYEFEAGDTTIKLPSIMEFFNRFCILTSSDEMELPSSNAISISRSSRSSSILVTMERSGEREGWEHQLGQETMLFARTFHQQDC